MILGLKNWNLKIHITNKKHLFVQQSIDIDIRRKYHKFMKQEEQMR